MVFPRGSQLFSKIATILQRLKSKQDYYISASAKELPGVEEMFHREKADFEVNSSPLNWLILVTPVVQ